MQTPFEPIKSRDAIAAMMLDPRLSCLSECRAYVADFYDDQIRVRLTNADRSAAFAPQEFRKAFKGVAWLPFLNTNPQP